FFFSSRRRHTRFSRDWSSDVCSSDLFSNAVFINREVICSALISSFAFILRKTFSLKSDELIDTTLLINEISLCSSNGRFLFPFSFVIIVDNGYTLSYFHKKICPRNGADQTIGKIKTRKLSRYRFIFSNPRRIETLTIYGRSPDLCFILLGPSHISIDAVVAPFVHIYSCGDSSGFTPDSLLSLL